LNIALRSASPSDLHPILEIAKAWPTHFVAAGIAAIHEAFQNNSGIIAQCGVEVVGFLIWKADDKSAELLWMAVRKDLTRRGIGSRLVWALEARLETGTTILVKTATSDSSIPGTAFDASGFSETIRFYEAVGFLPKVLLPEHWGPTNHALLMELKTPRIPG
jgi:GNAT superfamily N-acetyltransferase